MRETEITKAIVGVVKVEQLSDVHRLTTSRTGLAWPTRKVSEQPLT
jgi:hypothetical protein